MFLHYDFELSVYNKENDLVFFKKFRDKKIGRKHCIQGGRYKKYIPQAMEDFIENIFNNDEIKEILNN